MDVSLGKNLEYVNLSRNYDKLIEKSMKKEVGDKTSMFTAATKSKLIDEVENDLTR